MKKRTVRRRWPLLDPVGLAIGRAAKLTQAEIDAQSLPLLVAVDRLATGRWDGTDWAAVREAANRVEILTRLHRVSDSAFLLEVGMVVDSAIERLRTSGTKALRPAEVSTLRWLHESYANVLAETTRGLFADACDTAEREVKKILAERRNKAEKEKAPC